MAKVRSITREGATAAVNAVKEVVVHVRNVVLRVLEDDEHKERTLIDTGAQRHLVLGGQNEREVRATIVPYNSPPIRVQTACDAAFVNHLGFMLMLLDALLIPKGDASKAFSAHLVSWGCLDIAGFTMEAGDHLVRIRDPRQEFVGDFMEIEGLGGCGTGLYYMTCALVDMTTRAFSNIWGGLLRIHACGGG